MRQRECLETPPVEAYQIRIDTKEPVVPFYWIIWEDQVKPDQRTLYEGKVLSIINKAKQRADNVRVFTFYESSTSKFYFLYPFKNMADWDKIYTFWKQETELEDLKKHLQSYSIFLTQSTPILSHVPSDGFLSTKNQNYIHVDKFQIYPDQESKFIDLLKDWGAQIRTKSGDCGWFVQKIIIDEELPAYLVIWGDCLKSVENAKQLENFLIEKQAYGTIVKKIVSQDKQFIPQLSTASITFL